MLFSDLMKYPEFQEYSAFLFLNQFRLDEAMTSFLQERILTGDRFAAFVGPARTSAPNMPSGFSDVRSPSPPEEREAHFTAMALWPELDGQT